MLVKFMSGRVGDDVLYVESHTVTRLVPMGHDKTVIVLQGEAVTVMGAVGDVYSALENARMTEVYTFMERLQQAVEQGTTHLQPGGRATW